MEHIRHLLAIVAMMCAGVCESATILMVVSTVPSHMRLFTKLGVELAGEGHKPSLAWPSHVMRPVLPNNTGLTILGYHVDLEEPYMTSKEHSDEITTYAMSKYIMEKFELTLQILENQMAGFENECEGMFADADFMAAVRSGGFDLVIMDSAHVTCGYMLPYSMNFPYISVSIPITPPLMYRVPAFPSFSPEILQESTNRMTFVERLTTLVFQLASLPLINNTGVDHYTDKYAPGKAKLGQLGMTMNSAMFFFLDDDLIQYPKPQMPNTISIGDIMCRPAGKLPEDILKFVEEAEEGVIIVSFGSFIDRLPRVINDKICAALKQVKQRIIWKMKYEEVCHIPGKLLSLKWIPQNDLLGHPNVKLFITHGGISSFFETLYHATPVIACPLYLDQIYTGKMYEAKHYGKYITPSDFTSEELVEKIEFVLRDQDIQKGVSLASQLLKNKPQKAIKRVSYWINHVVKYGSDHLRSSAFELNPVQFYMMDLFFCIFLVIFIVVFVCYACVKFTIKLIKQLFGKEGRFKIKKS